MAVKSRVEHYERSLRRLTSTQANLDEMPREDLVAMRDHIDALLSSADASETPSPAAGGVKSERRRKLVGDERIAAVMEKTPKEGKYRRATRAVLEDDVPRTTGEIARAAMERDDTLQYNSFGNEVARMVTDTILVVHDENGPRKSKRYVLKRKGPTV